MAEEWKDIPSYEGIYQVSNYGKIRSLNYRRTGQTQLRAPQDNGRGYMIVQLSKENKCKWYLVHRLVAQAFIPNPEDKPTVNHIDGDRANNSVENLEWATYGENNAHSYRHNGRKSALAQPIYCIETGEVYSSSYDAARKTGFPQQSINKCANGKIKQSHGYHWGTLNNRKEKIYDK